MSGWAQWWPDRTQIPSTSRIEAMSCGCAPSIVKDTTPALFLTSFGPYVVTPFNRPSFSRAIERRDDRSEEHTSELQSRVDLVCRLLLEKKKQQPYDSHGGYVNRQPHHLRTQ